MKEKKEKRRRKEGRRKGDGSLLLTEPSDWRDRRARQIQHHNKTPVPFSSLFLFRLFPPHPPKYDLGTVAEEKVYFVPGNHRGIVEKGLGAKFGNVHDYVQGLLYKWLDHVNAKSKLSLPAFSATRR